MANPHDLTEMPRFAGFISFFRQPVAETAEGLDIAIFGVPFDLGCTNQSGTRLGPRQVREQSYNLPPVHPISNRSPFAVCRVADIGDVAVRPFDQGESLSRIEAFATAVRAAGAKPMAVGGDHLISLPLLRGLAADEPVGMVHFDAHMDTAPPVFADSPYDNGTPFRQAVEEGLLDPKRCIQIGIRGPRFAVDELKQSTDFGIRVVTIDELFERGPKEVIAEAREIVGDRPTYLTFDIDGLDASLAPGVPSSEIGGFTTREAQVMLRGLKGVDIVGADFVEVSPPHDPSGLTARVAANLVFEQIDLLAEAVLRAG